MQVAFRYWRVLGLGDRAAKAVGAVKLPASVAIAIVFILKQGCVGNRPFCLRRIP